MICHPANKKMCLHPLDVWSRTLPGHKGATTSVRSRRPVEQCRLGWLGTMDMIHMSSKVHIYIHINIYTYSYAYISFHVINLLYLFLWRCLASSVSGQKKTFVRKDESPIWMWHSAKESSCIFHWLLVDSCLIGINTLNVGAPGEGHCSVLIVTFAITQDGVPGVSIPEEAMNQRDQDPTASPSLFSYPQRCRTQEFQSCTWALFVLEHLQDSWHRWDLIVSYPSILTYLDSQRGLPPQRFPMQNTSTKPQNTMFKLFKWSRFVIFLSFD